ncbi:hypothetical protein MMC18_003717 [Xylographa bjoerkii]|nr:hypothetical protein [Xylographa bjoerkii]
MVGKVSAANHHRPIQIVVGTNTVHSLAGSRATALGLAPKEFQSSLSILGLVNVALVRLHIVATPPPPPDSNTITPGSTLPPQAAAVAAFASLVNSWLTNGQCQYDAALYSTFNKRDRDGLYNESSDKEVLLAREESSPPTFSLMVTAQLALIAAQSSAPTVLQAQMTQVWNNAMATAGSGYSLLTIASIQQFLTFNELADPTELINDLICVGPDASLWISQISSAQTELCVSDDVVTLEESLSKRVFANIADINALAALQLGHFPAAGRLINAIGTGAIRFEYFTWF